MLICQELSGKLYFKEVFSLWQQTFLSSLLPLEKCNLHIFLAAEVLNVSKDQLSAFGLKLSKISILVELDYY